MKKKLFFQLVVGLVLTTTYAQEVKDAMRYSQNELHGTARFTAMSGAFGALGGDLSGVNINPAGSAVFNNNQFATTMGNYSTNNESNYFGTTTSACESSFDLNQAGGVFVFKNRNPNGEWRKFSMSINYENTNIYDDATFSAGTSPVKSVANYFLSYADGVPLELLKNGNYAELDNGAQQAFLGYQGYIINPITNLLTNEKYTSNVRSGGNYYQENSTYSNGYNGKLVFNSAVQYKDNLFIGLNLNSHFLDYVSSSNFFESNNNPTDLDYRVKSLNFTNNLYTYGNGFSFQIGAIIKPTEALRLGFAYESPTWYNLRDEFSQRLSSVSINSVNALPPVVVDPFVINYYAPYELTTPGSFTGSFAYVFGKKGLISVDYKYKDYGSTQFEPQNDPYFRGVNSIMNSTLTVSNEIRVGGEYKVENFRFRGGYRFEGSPYKDQKTIGDLNSFSGGIGYSFGAIKVDLSYVNTKTTSQEPFFTQGFTESAKIETTKDNFTMTFVFEM